MNELRVFAAGARREMILLDERDTKRDVVVESSQGQIAGDSGAIDTTAQNQYIERFALQPLDIMAAADSHIHHISNYRTLD